MSRCCHVHKSNDQYHISVDNYALHCYFGSYQVYISEYFEDGTLNYLAILSLKHGFDQINKIPGGIVSVAKHTFHLAAYLHSRLENLTYDFQKRLPLVQMYSGCDNFEEQGGICNFNLLTSDGSHIGFTGSKE